MRHILIIAAFAAASPAFAEDLAVGQTFRCAGPHEVVAVVGRLDPDGQDGAVIASVSLFDLTPGAIAPEAGHIPISAEAFQASCSTPVAPRPLADGFEEGYGLWREAFEAGDGGYFTIPVSEILDMVTGMLPPQGADQ